MQLLDDLRSAQAELTELGKGHLASIRNDAEKLLPPIDRTEHQRGQTFSLPMRVKGAGKFEGAIVRGGNTAAGEYGKRITVNMMMKRERGLPAPETEAPQRQKVEQQGVEVRFGPEGEFEVSVDGHALWGEKNGKENLVPGALSLVVERLIAVSALLREEQNPRVIRRMEQAQDAIREKLVNVGLVPWAS